MKLVKRIFITMLCLSLLACGGHGFEGTYKSSVDSEMLNQMMSKLPQSTLTIGSDYIESNGRRAEVEEIFVRESNGKEFLIIKIGKKEESLEIIDKNTLQQNLGMAKIVFKRV